MLVMEEGVEGLGSYDRGVHLNGKAPAAQTGRQAVVLRPSSSECSSCYQTRPAVTEGLAVVVASVALTVRPIITLGSRRASGL